MNAPAGSFYITGGTLRHDAPCYVERQADRELLQALRRGEFCYLLTARQLGKSSLMVRTAVRLREEGVHVAVLDLTAVGQNLTAEQWYNSLMLRLGQQLDLEDEFERYWTQHERIGPCERLFGALREVALPGLNAKTVRAGAAADEPQAGRAPVGFSLAAAGRLVIFVDEIDTVRSLPFLADEFFAAVRECHNRRAEDPAFERLTFCLLGVATPSDLIQDTRLTPFNIGWRIELHDFTAAEAAPLAGGLAGNAGGRRSRRPEIVLARVLHWTNGHPYLTQRLCKALAEQPDAPGPSEVDRQCAALFLSHRAREQDDNLLFVRDRIVRGADDRVALLTLYAQVLRGRFRVRDDEMNPLVSALRLSGVVRGHGEFLEVRNRIYRRVFDREWMRANMPDAEVQRQRKAFWLGVLRASGIAAVVLAIVAMLALYAARQAENARHLYAELSRASHDAFLNQARSRRLLGEAGQHHDGLASLERAASLQRSGAIADATPVDLRNEAIACLILPDLRTNDTAVSCPPRTVVAAFDHEMKQYAYGDATGRIFVRRVGESLEALRLPGFGLAAHRLEFAPGGTRLAVAYTDARRQIWWIWDLPQRKPIVLLTNAAGDVVFDFADDNRRAAVGDGAAVRIFDLPAGTNHFLNLPTAPTVVRFRPGGETLAVSRVGSLKVELVEVATGRVSGSLHNAGPARALRWSHDGALLAVAGPNKRVRLWNPSTAREFDLEGHQDDPTHLAFSHAGRFLASAGPDNKLCLWEPNRSGRPLVTLNGTFQVSQLEFSLDDDRLAGNFADGKLQWWEVEPGVGCTSLFDPQAVRFTDLDVDPRGRLAAVAYEHGVALWDLTSGQRILSLANGSATALAFNPATRDLITADIYGAWIVPVKWPVAPATGPLAVGSRLHLPLPAAVSHVTCAPDGGSMALVWTNRIVVLNASGEATIADLTGGPEIASLALAPQHRWIAVAHGPDGEVTVRDLIAGNQHTLPGVRGAATLVCSHDGTRLAIGSVGACEIWLTTTWQPERTVQRPKPGARPSLGAFSTDGRTLACTADDTRIELIDLASGTVLAQLESARKEPLIALRFTRDGTRLVAATEASSVEVWRLAALRRELARMQLDWSAPQPATRDPVGTRLLTAVVVDDEPSDLRRKRERVLQLSEQLRSSPDNVTLLRQRAALWLQLEDYERSAADWRAVLKLQPSDTWALRDLAFLYLSHTSPLRNYPEAAVLAGRAAALEPGNADNLFRAGLAHYRMGSYTNALDYFEKVAALPPDKQGALTAFIQMHLAMTHARLGHLAVAREFYELANRSVQEQPLPAVSRPRFEEFRAEAEKLISP